MMPLTRRALLAGSAALALDAGPGRAAPAASQAQDSGFHRYRLGDIQLTSLYDGTWLMKMEHGFVRNASDAAVNKALATASLPPGILPVSYTALLVKTGSKLVLIDAGTGGQISKTAGLLIGHLAAAGIAPGAIDTILISHFHPDHIDGLKTKDGDKIFPNAEILVPEPEWAFWMDDSRLGTAPERIRVYFLNARRIFGDIAAEVRRFRPGSEVAPGITSIPAFGHTPGHTAFAIASGRESMLVMSDAVRNPYLFARYPDWQPSFDMDGPLAVKTRKQMLDRAAADRMLVEAYHFPFPASGYIARRGQGYELMPATA